jgi:hypothetical protein
VRQACCLLNGRVGVSFALAFTARVATE